MLCRDNQSESLRLKARCMCGEVGMLSNVFGTTPPLSVSTEKNKMATQGLYGVTSEIPCSLHFSLPTRANHSLQKGTVDYVVQLCLNQPDCFFASSHL